jgi:hypothetical protein
MAIGVMRTLAILALTVPLAGCFGVTAPKPLPDWAMASQVQSEEEPRRARRTAPARRTAETGSVTMPTVTHPAGLSAAAPAPQPARPVAREAATPTAFTPEWQAQENALDDRLRRRMIICNGC